MSIPSNPLDRLVQLSNDLKTTLSEVKKENPINEIFIRSVPEGNPFEAKQLPSGLKNKCVAFFERLLERITNPQKYDIVTNLKNIAGLYDKVLDKKLDPEQVAKLNTLAENLSLMRDHVVGSLKKRWLQTDAVRDRIEALEGVKLSKIAPPEDAKVVVPPAPAATSTLDKTKHDVAAMTEHLRAAAGIEPLDEEGKKALRRALEKSIASSNVLRLELEQDTSVDETDKASLREAIKSNGEEASSLIDHIDAKPTEEDSSETEEVEEPESHFDVDEHEIAVLTPETSGWKTTKLVGQAALQVFGAIAEPLFYMYQGDYRMAAVVVAHPLVNLGVSTGLTVASEKLLPENVKPYAREVIMPLAAISSAILTVKGIDYVHGQMAYNVHTNHDQPPQNATNVTQPQPMIPFADTPVENVTVAPPVIFMPEPQPQPQPPQPMLFDNTTVVAAPPPEAQIVPPPPPAPQIAPTLQVNDELAKVEVVPVPEEKPAFVEPAAKTASFVSRVIEGFWSARKQRNFPGPLG